jgi:putative colanic acid biosynthesis acetyltransferase WcaF
MSSGQTDLSAFNNKWYNPGASVIKRALWFCFNTTFFCSRFPFSGFKRFLLRMFGARVGKAVIIRPGANIKAPWFLEIGDNAWIGENAWIDNLAKTTIASDCCISQGAMLLTGNHDYSKTSFDLIAKGITLEKGVWIGAKAVVCPGVTCKSHSVLTVASVASSDLEAYSIYRGNPAVKVRERIIK